MPIELGSFSLGSVAGGIVGVIAGHYLTKSRNTEDREIKGSNDAAAKFRAAIITELTGLYPIPIDWPDDIGSRLNATSPKIQAAVEEFKPFVTDGTAFNEAWLQYYTHYKHTIPKAFNLANKIYENEKIQSVRDEFKHNIENLLSFAKEK